jgi:hypothetical protein
LIFTGVSALLIFIILYFVYPLKYTAKVVLLPPEEQNTTGLQALIGGSDVTSFLGFSGGFGSAQLFAEVLKSRSVSEIVLQQNQLYNFLKIKDTAKAVEKLQTLISVEVTKERLIKFEIPLSTSTFSRFSSEKDSIRLLVSKVANSFTYALDLINREKLQIKATNLMYFFEEQINIASEQLRSDEEALRLFQEKNKTISIPEQLSATLETAAKIKSEILFTRIELKNLEFNMRENNSRIESLRKKLEVLNQTYKEIEGIKSVDEIDYLPEFNDIPKLSLELARLTRNVKVSNELYIMLQKQFYREQIQANRNVPTVEVLDPAVPPTSPSSPRVLFSSFFGGFFAFFLVSSLTLYLEKKKKN